MFKTNQSRALKILETGENSDCVIVVKEEQNDGEKKKTEFNVHKFVLIVNSEVFRAMFSHKNIKEFRESRIEICDSTATVVHQMLIYLYTGALPYGKYDAEKDAVPLMQIAHKYQIKSLLDFNEDKLICNLSFSNVFDRLKLAEFYQMNSLEMTCFQFIQRNLLDLTKRVKWLELKMTDPKLAFSILENFVDEYSPKKQSEYNCESPNYFP